jgi:hypothetical protein
VLVQSNFGVMRSLRVDGAPVGEMLEPSSAAERRVQQRRIDHLRRGHRRAAAVVAMVRLCKRAALGIGGRLVRGPRLGRDHRGLLDANVVPARPRA